MYGKKSSPKQPHLVFTEASGFQYYLTFPKFFAHYPRLPRQLRWSLGRDEALARQMGHYLNRVFTFPFITDQSLSSEEVDRIESTIKIAHQTIGLLSQDADKIWTIVPHPAELSRTDMRAGRERIKQLSETDTVLFKKDRAGELVFTLRPSRRLRAQTRMNWFRMDWPLGTQSELIATDAVIYILTAIDHLERIEYETHEGEQYIGAFVLLALYEYLRFARPDKGAELDQLPDLLPQSLTALKLNMRMNTSRTPLRFLRNARVDQHVDGFFVISHEMSGSIVKSKQRFELNLNTTSPITAYLLYMKLSRRFDAILVRHCREGFENGRLERAMTEINELLKRATASMPPVEPLPSIKNEPAYTPEPKMVLEPATQALVDALSSLLPDTQKQRLEAFLSNADEALTPVSPAQPDVQGMTVSKLVEHYESTQLAQGAWRNPRTQISVHARLEAMCELLGGHRMIGTLTRGDLITLRDRIRQYPKNRNNLHRIRYSSLDQLMSDPAVPSIAPRTAKKFFELIRAVIRHAYDNDFLSSDIAHNLVFVVKGADQPRKRTYNPGQIKKLLLGPALTAKTPPKWRLDDYKFWLPLLGLYTGCRLAELCQLQIADVYVEDGVWLINISRSGLRQLKTIESERSIPLHASLLAMGFLKFVEMRRVTAESKLTPLFENLPVYGVLATSHVASRWFLGDKKLKTGYLGLCGLGEDDLTFHGLRHSFIQQFRRQKLDMLIVKALVGHADRSTTGGYGDVYPANVLKEELDKLDYGVVLEHINYSHYVALQKKQGNYKIGRPSKNIPK